MKYRHSYIVSMQFLGFRFHGWQKQTNAKTLHDMVDKSLSFVFNHYYYKTLGVGRTDSKVSANHYIFQLFINEKVEKEVFIKSLNSNLPADFKALSVEPVATNFNIIQHPKTKEYLYFFSFGEKNHPFTAPFITGIDEDLDIGLMKKGAEFFEGEHYLHKYCTQPSAQTIFKRTIDCCEILENDIYIANFFPKQSYYLRVKGSGFLRYQIRLMMSTLFDLGKGKINLQDLEQSLKENNDRKPLKSIAPASGLQLYSIELKDF